MKLHKKDIIAVIIITVLSFFLIRCFITDKDYEKQDSPQTNTVFEEKDINLPNN